MVIYKGTKLFTDKLFTLDIDKKTRNTYIQKCNLISLFFEVILVWNRRAVGENSYTQSSCRESEQPAGTDFSQNSRPYIILKLSRDPLGHLRFFTHALLVLHWSRLTPTHFFMPRISCPRISAFPVVTLFILSRTGCICQLVHRRSMQYITQTNDSSLEMCMFFLVSQIQLSKYK